MSKDIRVRQATPSDFDAISHIAVEAHHNDEKFAYLFPKRNVHVKAYRKYFRTHVEHHNIIPDCFVIVAELVSSNGSPQIAGYCLWNHDAKSKTSGELQDKGQKENPMQAMLRHITTSMLAYYVSMLLNPAASLYHNLHLGNDDEHYNDPNYEEPGESWGINEIAVAPDFQRQGIGMRLLQWGIDRAIANGVPVTLASTPAGVRLYEKAGFHECGTWKWAKEANEVYTMMRWDPPTVSQPNNSYGH